MKRLRTMATARRWYKAEDYQDVATLDAEGWRNKLMERIERGTLDDFEKVEPDLVAQGLAPVTDIDEIDHFLIREPSVQPCDDLQTLRARHRIALEVDPYCPDQILIEQFKREVETARQQMGIDIKRRGAGRPKDRIPAFNSPIRFNAWRAHKILELTDIEYRTAKEGYLPLTNIQLADILFPSSCSNEEKSKQISEARNIRVEAFAALRTLQAQTKHDRDHKVIPIIPASN